MATMSSASAAEHKSGRERLTDKYVSKLTAPPGKRVEIADTIVREMRIRVSDKGAKNWSLLYRVAGAGENQTRGPMKRMTLGPYPLVTLEQAREKARDALDTADRGIDPSAKREEEVAQRKTRAFEVVLDRFVELHVKQNTHDGRVAKERAATLEAERAGKIVAKGPKSKLGRAPAQRLIEDFALPIWRGRLIETITRAEAHDLLDDVVGKRGEPIARELRKHLAKLFNWAADRGHIPANPLAGMRRPELGYVARERVLSMDEMHRVWDAAGQMGYPFGNMIRLLILTGQRRSEIAELERDWIETDHRAVAIPAARYKTRRTHLFPLPTPAWTIVEALPRWNDGNCMFSTTSGNRPVSGFSKAKLRLDEIIAERGAKDGFAPLPSWTIHDIRRSVSTHMARIGILQEHIERVLGHVIPGMAGVYNKYSYLDEKRAALEKWGKLWASHEAAQRTRESFLS